MTQVIRRSSYSPFSSLSPSPGVTKVVTLQFELEVWTKPGQSVCLIGDRTELGSWEGKKAVKLASIEAFSKWVSPPVTFEMEGNALSIEYMYISITTSEDLCEELTSSRRFTLLLGPVDRVTHIIRSSLTGPDQETVDIRAECSIFREINLEEPFGRQLDLLGHYLEQKTHHISLKKLVAIFVYFKWVCETQKDSANWDENGNCERLLALTKLLFTHMTEEIRPIVGKIVLLMARCCITYKEIMKSITNVHLVQHKKVDFGCEWKGVEGLLEELFSTSHRDGLGMLRVIILNSIRGALRGLEKKSTRPELLLMYDVWISVLQRSYIETQFLSSDPSNIPNLLHQVSILAEFSHLGGICPEIFTLAGEIQENSNPMETRTGLIRMLETTTWWLARYVEGAKTIEKEDLLGLKRSIIDIGIDTVEILLPVIYRALYAVSHSIGPTFSLGLCFGTAAGKVFSLPDMDEIPSDHSAIIAIIKPTKAPSSAIPQQVKGIVQVGDSYLSSYLLAHCLQHSIPFGLVTREWRDRGDKVELRVTQEKISLF